MNCDKLSMRRNERASFSELKAVQNLDINIIQEE